MEETLELMLYGCKLAKDLEQNVPVLANLQPDVLLTPCDEIIRVFSSVKARLITQGSHMRQSNELRDQISAGIQEWLRSGASTCTTTTSTPMDLLNAQVVLGDRRGLDASRTGGDREIQPPLMDAPDSSRGSPSHSQRKRKDGEKIVKRVAAPQMGNLDLPPEDGYTWRKYGQKEILGSIYPRSYYRCTHQKFYECPAKKQVQRLDDDPFTFEVTYRGHHTCHVSSTAPIAAAPPSEVGPTTTMHNPPLPISSSSLPNNQWLSMQIFHGGASATSSGGAGPSATRFPDYQMPVADMADAMFNSGSSSSNSMDLIFSSMDDKCDSEVKKA